MENQSEILLYQTEDGQTKVEVRLEGESVWLTQEQMSELFQRERSVITKHINNIFAEGELEEKSNVQNLHISGSDRPVKFYNLDVIISVGYRVKSHRGTQFRIWATQRLKEYIVKGFTLDDERLKRGGQMNYFDELLERIRDIRSSKKVFYQKIKEIYATSIDYDATTKMTQDFFKIVQNKLIWAVSQQTAAEIIASRADADKPNMGLTTWANAPKGKIRKTDVTVSKNYLNAEEIKALNLLVEQFLAFAEAQAQQQKPMYMKDWIKKLNDILTINEREILEHAGRITKQLADETAKTAFEKYKSQQQALEKEESIQALENEIKKLKGGSSDSKQKK